MQFARQGRKEIEEESAFVSMTDLMISILFIVMILMAFFARSVSNEGKTVPEPEYLEVVEINEELRDEIDKLRLIIVQLEKDIEVLKDEIKTQKKTIEEQEKLIAELTEKINLLDQLIIDLQNTIKDKNLEIETLNKDIIKLEKEIEELKDEIKKLKALLEKYKKTRDTELAKVLDDISESRLNILNSIKLKLSQNNINVKIDTISGIVRFDNSVINFTPGSYKPTPTVTTTIRKVAEVLEEELGCYALGEKSRINLTCNPNLSLLEAVQLEGHTDNVPLGARSLEVLEDNLDLSARRAASAFRIMIDHRPALMEFRNANIVSESQFDANTQEGQPILSISAYGEFRPVAENKVSTRAANRRIDLRIIMTTPKNVEEAKRLSNLINVFISNKDD